jgi:hypothetical protein
LVCPEFFFSSSLLTTLSFLCFFFPHYNDEFGESRVFWLMLSEFDLIFIRFSLTVQLLNTTFQSNILCTPSWLNCHACQRMKCMNYP